MIFGPIIEWKIKNTTLLRQFQNPIKKQSKTKIDNPNTRIHDH